MTNPMLKEIVDEVLRHRFILLHLRNQWLDNILSKISNYVQHYKLVDNISICK